MYIAILLGRQSDLVEDIWALCNKTNFHGFKSLGVTFAIYVSLSALLASLNLVPT